MKCDGKLATFSTDDTSRLLRRDEYNANIEQPRGTTLVLLLPFVPANGSLFAIVYFLVKPSRMKPLSGDPKPSDDAEPTLTDL